MTEGTGFRCARSARLAGVVEKFWYVESSASSGMERKLPTGSMQIIVNLDSDRLSWLDGQLLESRHDVGGAAVTGASAAAVGIDASQQRRVLGISLCPAAAGACLGVPACTVNAPLVELADLWGSPGAVLREQLLELTDPADMFIKLRDLLLHRLTGGPDVGMVRAVDYLDRGYRVADVVDQLGTTASTFTRNFRAEVGLHPKRYQRVRRLQRVLDAAGHSPGGWAEIATSNGFHDQAHLIRDFVELTGLTPTRYQPRSDGAPNHVALE